MERLLDNGSIRSISIISELYEASCLATGFVKLKIAFPFYFIHDKIFNFFLHIKIIFIWFDTISVIL